MRSNDKLFQIYAKQRLEECIVSEWDLSCPTSRVARCRRNAHSLDAICANNRCRQSPPSAVTLSDEITGLELPETTEFVSDNCLMEPPLQLHLLSFFTCDVTSDSFCNYQFMFDPRPCVCRIVFPAFQSRHVENWDFPCIRNFCWLDKIMASILHVKNDELNILCQIARRLKGGAKWHSGWECERLVSLDSHQEFESSKSINFPLLLFLPSSVPREQLSVCDFTTSGDLKARDVITQSSQGTANL